MVNNKTVSVVIPVKNEAKKIRACIEGILSQTVDVLEIIVIDSGSTDGTLDILKAYEKVKIVEIPGSEFNHGLTRNLGVEQAKGEFVLLTVGDAEPYDENWIQHLLDGFIDDSVAGVCGMQVVPHDLDKNPADWYRPISDPIIKPYSYPNGAFDKLSPAEKKLACGWDDVTAMYRKDLKLTMPFEKTTYAEDAIWAKQALKAGYTIVYNTAARVYHYHLEDADFAFKRTYTVMYYRYKNFGIIPQVPDFGLISSLKLINILRKSDKVSLADKLKWWNYNQTTRNGIKKAAIAVKGALDKGEEFLDAEHQRLCGKPPIPRKD